MLIKDVCQEAGFKIYITISKKKGGEFIKNKEMMYKFISSHKMRGTFITMLLPYIEIANIQAVSVHKDIRVSASYINRNT